MRKPFQGTLNIIRFNWHFYVLSFGFVITVLTWNNYFQTELGGYVYALCLLIAGTIIVSLLVSYYVYDYSQLYKFNWLGDLITDGAVALNINAGFDETSELLNARFHHQQFTVLDFYDPKRHTEISIKRARAAYPAFPNTIRIATTKLPIEDKSIDTVYVIFSAHEIRDENERTNFFKELNRVIKPEGQIVVVEHLRDFNNFFAYNIGFMHFYSLSTWLSTFKAAQLKVHKEIKVTPFISTFLLQSDGDTY